MVFCSYLPVRMRKTNDRLIYMPPCLPYSLSSTALDAHVREARRRGWVLPQLAYKPGVATMPPLAGERLLIQDMWPYWLEREKATRNSFDSTKVGFAAEHKT